MDVKYYNQMSMAARNNEPWTIPEEFFTDGEWDVDKMMTILEEYGYITTDPLTINPKLQLDFPEVFDLLKTILDNQQKAVLDSMEEQGLVSLCMSEEGEVLYVYTESGAEIINAILAQG